MLVLPLAKIEARARAMAPRITGANVSGGESVLGGGSTPDQSIPTWLIAISGPVRRLEKQLRASNPAVVARIEKDQLLIDLRTVFPEDDETLAAMLERYARSM